MLVPGLTFKENCPDVRNSKVVDTVRELRSYGALVDVHDPWADVRDAREEYGIELVVEPKQDVYDVIVLAVAHQQFREMGVEKIRAFGKDTSVLYDIKYLLARDLVDDRL